MHRPEQPQPLGFYYLPGITAMVSLSGLRDNSNNLPPLEGPHGRAMPGVFRWMLGR